jgi:hypothetical protein
MNAIGAEPNDWDKHFILVNDVNLAQYTGTQFNIIGIDPYLGTPFTGVFDGNDHKIWNFTWSSTGRNDIGLFGNLGSGGHIKNLGMENVDVNAVNGWHVGGLVGTNSGTIRDCYAVATVDGEGCVGGLVGWGGGKVRYSFWDIETSDQSTSAGGTPKTTIQMKTMSTFTEAGWDFVEVWGIGEGQTYPFLRTEPAGDSNYDKKVDLIDLAILASHWLEGK